eukprot:TRINITY_DN1571_c0_g1_i1.p1 TRINITY_DN1571_c0_g1~~TRINITY_DN1571_c0_g1_i1.p1  ORF type:complete len:371 (+),score=-1.62 TRINITY_DN1571_c0_g1_i1:53-1165(+)
MEVTLFTTHLRLIYQSNHYDFHYIWLNHNCRCQNCIHPFTRERVRDACEIPEDITVDDYRLDGESLTIKWKNDNVEAHETHFSAEWLIQNAYAVNSILLDALNTDVSTIEIDFKTVDQHNTQSFSEYRKSCYEHLIKYGVVLVRNRGLDTESIIKDFIPPGADVIHTHFGRFEDLKVNNTTNKHTDQLGYTNAPVLPHTDLPFVNNPPGLQMLHCIQPASKGGENYIINAQQAVDYLRKTDSEAYRLLTTIKVKFHRKQKEYESIYECPLISVDEQGKLTQVRYSYFTYAPFNIPFELMESWYRAYNKFARIVRDRKNQLYFRLNAEDFVIYDNYAVLHAREGFSGDRHLRGVYLDTHIVLDFLKLFNRK